MSDDDVAFRLIVAPTARCQLAEQLPESVAFAAYEFIVNTLPSAPKRVGKRLQPPLQDQHSARRGTYRIIYVIDDDEMTVTVLNVAHRQDINRP